MVIRGSVRGNGKQLAGYLLSTKENEKVHILEAEGKHDPDKKDFFYALTGMSLTSDLTKSDKGLYHAIINPGYGDDQRMRPEDWIKAADILAKHTKFDNQRRVIVLHEKKGRTHAHVVFERYDHALGKMKSDSWNYRGQDKARFEMEKVFAHEKTPTKNIKRPEARLELTKLWHEAKSGKEFIAAAKSKGYIIAKGEGRRPYMVIDKSGRSFDLVRELQGAKTKDVKARLQGEKLKTDKEEIERIRIEQAKEPLSNKLNLAAKKAFLAKSFANNREGILEKENQPVFDVQSILAQKQKDAEKSKESPDDDKTKDQERYRMQAKDFAESRDTIVKETDMERFKRELMEKLDSMRREQKEKDKDKDKGYEY